MKIEWIHCGDLHLGNFPNHLEERFQDYFKAFLSIVNYAISHSVPIILVSGDFFHLKNINAKTLQKTIEVLERAKKNAIKVFVIEGNHDKAFYIDEDSWLTFLHEQKYIILLSGEIVDGVWTKTEYTCYETEHLRITGVGYLGGATSKHLPEILASVPQDHRFNIVMLHAAIDRLSGQEMGDIKSEEIATWKNRVDYVALGHIHNRYEFDDFCFNPGSVENIHLRDNKTGEKGFYHVIVENDQKKVQYIKAKPRTIHFEKIDASCYQTPMEAQGAILNQNYDFKAGNMAMITLYGQTTYNAFLLDIKTIEETLKEEYHLLHIEVENRINIARDIKQASEEVNMQTIIHQMIEDQLRFYYPEQEQINEQTDTIMNMTELLKEDADFDTIVDHLYDKEVQNED